MTPRTLADCSVLMVDDEVSNLELLEEFLLPEGFASLVRTSDAREAVPLFEAHAPDVVLLDLHMPHLDGFEVLRRIQQRTQPGDFVPVLVLTADASRATRARALSSGAHDFLTKPLDALEVRLRVCNLLKTRLLHQEQRRAREEAEAATRARELVLSVVAHDLRNPLASIAMDAEMARHLLSDEEHRVQRRTIERIERTAQRMHALIEDLLEVSRLERGTFAVHAAPVAPHTIFSDAEAMLQPLARARGVRLRFQGPGELPSLHADAGRIVQVLSNLVGNALRFTPAEGSAWVRWSRGEGELVVVVEDSGEGIPNDQLPHVFDPFWQGGSESQRRGLGLGLAITRAIIEAHAGRIGIESAAGVGTTVRFTLPFSVSRVLPAALVPSLAHEPDDRVG
jgi:signal transduction histidine kinase